ncbi:hypothetical protein ACM64Y_13615 [Novispirillum sp. DQ9]|uniref:hypothetical protein n=1 Tax=Novispirillum sp. DQ9 TaxID=3398612 RepID=UPI003C7BF7ED
MTSVTPTAPPPLPPSPQPAAVATVTAPPEVVQRLEALKILEAHVAAMTSRTQAVVDTPVGQVALRLPPSLPVVEGTRLTLQVMNALDSQAHARITAIDGRPLAPATLAPAAAPAAPGSGVAGGPGAAQTPAPVQWAVSPRPVGLTALLVQVPPNTGTPTTGTPTTGTPTPGAPTVGAPTPGTPAWPLGTELTVRLASVTMPGQPLPGGGGAPVPGSGPGAALGSTPPPGLGQPAPSGGAVPASGLGAGSLGSPPPTAGMPATGGGASPSAAGPAAPPPASGATPSPATIAAGTPTTPGLASAPSPALASSPTSTPTAATPAAAGGPPSPTGAAVPPAGGTGTVVAPAIATLTGTTVAQGGGTLPLIVTPAGTLAVQTAVPLPPGAVVVLEVTGVQTPLPPAPPPGGPPPLPPSGPAGAAVAQAMAVLASDDPEAARRLAAALPAADARLLSNAVAFAQAATVGGTPGLRAWVGGDTLRALERAGPRGADALRGLTEGLREASTVVRDSAGAEWRSLSMPFAVGGTIERIQIVTRRTPGDGEEGEESADGGKGGGGQRFLIRLDLSRLGAMQLDGLYKKARRRLDLIVRTHARLPVEMQRDLSGLFATSATALGLKGALSFQVTAHFDGPLADPHGGGGGTGMMV